MWNAITACSIWGTIKLNDKLIKHHSAGRTNRISNLSMVKMRTMDWKEIQSVNLKGKSVLNIHWKDWSWSWNSSTLATGGEEPNRWKRPWCWERLRAGREGGDRGWDGWMASPTQCTWVWAISGRQLKTGKPGMLQSMRLQRVWHNLATEQEQQS